MKRVLVIGAGGQLGKTFQKLYHKLENFDWVFADKKVIDITHFIDMMEAISSIKPDIIINCAAYTNVKECEDIGNYDDINVNVNGSKNLAIICNKFNIKLIHISTDYVFSGTSGLPYVETDKTYPNTQYGHSKLRGENEILKHCPDAIIIRTSALWSTLKINNFVNTIINALRSKIPFIEVINDQTTTPTLADDLVMAIYSIIQQDWVAGIYHYSNMGYCTWYEFALEIQALTGLSKVKINKITTAEHNDNVNRPKYSVLNKSKIIKQYGLAIPHWGDSLERELLSF